MTATVTVVGGITFTPISPVNFVDDSQGPNTSQLLWHASGSNARADVAGAALSVIPALDDTLVLRRVKYDQIGYTEWGITADYESADAHEEKKELDEGEFRITFDTTGSKQRISHSDTTNVTKYGTSAVDYQGAINVGPDGKPQGIDVVIPALKLTIAYKHTKAFITQGYMKQLAELTGKKNNAQFLGFAAETLLFLGATGGDGSRRAAEVTYNFLHDEKQTGLTFGSVTPVTKEGHDYLWIDYEPGEDTTAKHIRPEVRGVYVHKIYTPKSFANLGLTL